MLLHIRLGTSRSIFVAGQVLILPIGYVKYDLFDYSSRITYETQRQVLCFIYLYIFQPETCVSFIHSNLSHDICVCDRFNEAGRTINVRRQLRYSINDSHHFPL